MKRTRCVRLAVASTVVFAFLATTEGQEAQKRRGPEKAFERLDWNRDGRVELDDVPEAAPEFMKRMLEKADKNGDRIVTSEEFAFAARQFRPRVPLAEDGNSQAFFRLKRPISDDGAIDDDMLTPAYYRSDADSSFKREVDRFLTLVRRETFHHPLKDESGRIPDFSVPVFGRFGAGKGRDGTATHHPAIDLRVGEGKTEVALFAAHDGVVSTVRDAPKYRHYVSITKIIKNDSRQAIGKLVTIYGHVDLDLDEGDSLAMDGRRVNQGDLISRHLYAHTRGGPHLHFEVRYYRKEDVGTETFYGDLAVAKSPDLAERSGGPWTYGYWNPDVGFGFGHPKRHGLPFASQ